MTADRPNQTDDQASVSSSRVSLLSADSDGTAPDSESVDITSRDPQQEHTWYSLINPADINPLYDVDVESDLPDTSGVTFEVDLSASGGQDQSSVISIETSI
ncbi:hypothetical protein DAEQUDRAFT_763585 [Daedalea quercina L-15889]|uniref:Uncharacterized protein n=1 Tax=Daedalea quercina L-15889 TaxID=1314783 RepID=A0A165SAV5_9APHY|nr:hypothetical protein DAEQUDRAFT_763585 [Daedalea quercina L-15889]